MLLRLASCNAHLQLQRQPSSSLLLLLHQAGKQLVMVRAAAEAVPGAGKRA
jgi:hypothetical protein